jgi:hypothetical protein
MHQTARGSVAQRIATVLALFTALLALAAPASAGGVTASARSEMSVYADSDAVTVLTPAVSGKVEEDVRGWSAEGSYLVDVVSAASVDVVSTASPRWTEVRHAGTLEGGYRVGRLGASLHGAVSTEPDYLALAGGGLLAWSLPDRSGTPSIGYSLERDEAGRTGTPFSVYSKVLVRHTVTAGVELVLGPATTLALGTDAILESGEQEKPYRYLPMFDARSAAEVEPGASLARVNRLRLPGRMTESLPHERRRFALAGRLAHRFSGATLLAFDRLYADDWGLLATTLDARFGVDLGRRLFPWLHVRGHTQAGAHFWRRAYVAELGLDGESSVPLYRTGDRELGPLRTLTLGLGGRWLLGSASAPSRLALVVQGDAIFTRFPDALYIGDRTGLLAVAQLEVSP